jgi:hypothetical protein
MAIIGCKFYQKILYGLKMSNYKKVEGREVCEGELYLRNLSLNSKIMFHQYLPLGKRIVL